MPKLLRINFIPSLQLFTSSPGSNRSYLGHVPGLVASARAQSAIPLHQDWLKFLTFCSGSFLLTQESRKSRLDASVEQKRCFLWNDLLRNSEMKFLAKLYPSLILILFFYLTKYLSYTIYFALLINGNSHILSPPSSLVIIHDNLARIQQESLLSPSRKKLHFLP